MLVVSSDGPGLYNAYGQSGAGVSVRRVSGPPATIDLVYAYRPLAELADIAALARRLGARALWVEHLADAEVEAAREIARETGLALVTNPPIAVAATVARAAGAD